MCLFSFYKGNFLREFHIVDRYNIGRKRGMQKCQKI